jgi:uncharacterized protein
VELAGSTVLLTGASGGIGKAIARALSARGAKVILTGRRAGVLEELREGLGDGASVVEADLADAATVRDLPGRLGPVDVLVANAALPASGRGDSFSPEEIDRALDVNLRAPMVLARLLCEGMAERGGGHLVFVSSLSGKAATPRASIYAATKFGLRGFAQSLREDLRTRGVGVSTVLPGFIRDAGMFHDANTKLPPYVGTKTPDDVAEAVISAIEGNRAEVEVAPIGVRIGATLASLAPELAASVQRRLGADDVAAQMESGQRSKR